MESTRCFALLSDFGYQDEYVGILHGVLAGIVPSIPIHDICHSIPPGDIRRAALMLWQSLPYFPEGTIFVAVVDPGVGSRRLPIIRQSRSATIVCPDNGISSFAEWRETDWATHEIRNTEWIAPHPSATFHGRDIFAPAAGHLARGIPIQAFGPVLAVTHPLSRPVLHGDPTDGWEGEVLYHDHFGNAVTSIGCFSQDGCTLAVWIPEAAQSGTWPRAGKTILEDGAEIPFRHYYQEDPVVPLIAVVGSSGLLEIAAPNGRASKVPALRQGASVYFVPQG